VRGKERPKFVAPTSWPSHFLFEILLQSPYRRRRATISATAPIAAMAHEVGSGIVVTFNVQVFTCAVLPPSKSERNKIHVPFGSAFTNELKPAFPPASKPAGGVDIGSTVRPSGAHVPVTCPEPLSEKLPPP